MQATPETAPLIRVKGLVVRFPVRQGTRRTFIEPVRNVSFDIAPREIVALVGESGSGKTTVGRALVKTTDVSNGRVEFAGQDITRLPAGAVRKLHADVQLVFQDPFAALNPTATVYDHLALPVRVYEHLRGAAIRQRVTELLEQVGLVPAAELREKYPHELSGGQRQRVVIARALAARPRFIVADEPVSMLDVSIRADILRILRDLRDRLGISLLYITHDLASARYLADRIMVLYGGQIMEVGPAREIVQNPVHPYTRLLLAAVPGRTDALPQVAESAPDLGIGRTGCPFRPRCPYAAEACANDPIPVIEMGTGHSAACVMAKPDSKSAAGSR